MSVCNVEYQPTQREWVVTCVDGTFTQSHHATQDEAIWAARQQAKNIRPSTIKIHAEDGTLQSEHPYR